MKSECGLEKAVRSERRLPVEPPGQRYQRKGKRAMRATDARGIDPGRRRCRTWSTGENGKADKGEK